MSYITGAHAFKVGLHAPQRVRRLRRPSTSSRSATGSTTACRTSSRCARCRAALTTRSTTTLGIFAQDRWTDRRLTLSVGMRYDYFANSFPEQPSARPCSRRPDSRSRTGQLSWHDLTPKLGAAYDLFGNGKTAVKVSLNRYLAERLDRVRDRTTIPVATKPRRRS